jgi:hypothetical protein
MEAAYRVATHNGDERYITGEEIVGNMDRCGG